MALLDFLKEKKNETRIGLHPLEIESDDFKYYYCFGLATAFCDNERVYREARPIFENIIDLLGLHENRKTSIPRDVSLDFDYRIYEVFRRIDTKERQYCFLSDLIRMETNTLWGQQYLKDVIAAYAEVFSVTKEEMAFLEEFFACAQKQEMERAIALYNEFGRNGNYISFKLLSYMYPSIALRDSFASLVIEAGEKIILDKPTLVEGSIQVRNGGSLEICGAAVTLRGAILVDGGRLDVRRSRIQVRECPRPFAIRVRNSAVILMEDTRILGNHECGLIKQDCGHLILRDCELRGAGRERAVAFSGRSLSLIRTRVADCLQGGVSNSGSSRLLAKECEFSDCVADHGGAIHSDSLEDARVQRCAFRRCRAGFLGAAVYFSYKKYRQLVQDCVLEECEPESGVIYNAYAP